MTTATMNTDTATSFKLPNFVQLRAALPDMPATRPTFAGAMDVVTSTALAAIPVAVLGFLFVLR